MTHYLRTHQAGLGLVELMIAMTLGVILIAGVLEIFASNKKAFEITSDLGILQENGRIGSATIAQSVRMAGHWGGVAPAQVKVTPGTVGTGCDVGWALAAEQAIRGFEGAGSLAAINGLPNNCFDSGDYRAGTDLLVLRYADAQALYEDSALTAGTHAKHFFSRVAIGQQAALFQGRDSASAIGSIASGRGVYNFGYRAELYFIRPCSIKVGTSCTDGIPTLTRLTLSGNRFVQQALIEGVEQLQFEYGVDEDGNRTVDRYQNAGEVADWSQVLSVKMSLLTRSASIDVSLDETGKEYLLVGDMAQAGSGYVVPSNDRQYRRKVVTREIHLRNLSRL